MVIMSLELYFDLLHCGEEIFTQLCTPKMSHGPSDHPEELTWTHNFINDETFVIDTI